MTLAMHKKGGKLKREEMELPANVWRLLIAHIEGMSWIEASKVANLTPHAMRQWRKHPDAERLAIACYLSWTFGGLEPEKQRDRRNPR